MMLMYHTMFGIVDGRLSRNMGNCSIQFFYVKTLETLLKIDYNKKL